MPAQSVEAVEYADYTSVNPGCLENVKYLFIAITLRSTLTYSGR